MANDSNLQNNLNPADLDVGTASDSGLSYPVPPPGQADGFFRPLQTRAEFESWIAQNRKSQQEQSTTLNQYGLQREPWIFSTFETISRIGDLRLQPTSGDGYNSSADPLFWTASPKSVTWQVSQRASEDKNKSGTVLHVWRDRRRRTDYDDPKITIQFQSGSIHPILSNTGQTIAPGLNNFYQYLQLVDSPKIASTGEANTIHILYRSTIFPSMVITGMFDPQLVVQFTDDSQNPYQVMGWSANFTIYSTIPRLNSFSELRDRFVADGLVLNGNFNVEQTPTRVPTVTTYTGQFQDGSNKGIA